MKKELISELFEKFEEACYALEGLECWSGRELQEILGYSDWTNFTNTIQKAVKSSESSGEKESDHFVGVTKTIDMQFISFGFIGLQVLFTGQQVDFF